MSSEGRENKIYQSGEVNINIDTVTGSLYVYPYKKPPANLTTIPNISLTEVIGRAAELENLMALTNISEKIVLVNGTGGIGKTTLTKAFVKKYRENFNYAAWIDASTNLKEAFVFNTELTDNLLYDLNEMNFKDPEFIDKCFKKIINSMRSLEGNNLLIIDNISSELEHENLIDYLSLKPNWKVIVTSREQLEGFSTFELKNLSSDAAKELFYMHYEYSKEDNILDEILKTIDFNTLLIELIAKTSQQRRVALPDILELLKKKGLNISEEASIKVKHNYNQKVENILKYIIKIFSIANLSEYEKWLLLQFSVLPSVYISYLKNNGININHFLQIQPGEQKDSFTDSLNYLVKTGWLNWDKSTDSFKMHQFIQEVIRYNILPKWENCSYLINTLDNELFISDEESPFAKKNYIIFADSILKYIKDPVFEVASLSNNLATFYYDFGNMKKALKFQNRSLQIKEKILAANDPSLFLAYNNISTVYRNLNELNSALEYQRKAIAIGEKLNDSNYLEIAGSYNNFALILQDLGNFKEALKYYKKALNIKEKILDKNHISLARGYNNISVIYEVTGRLEKALFYHKKALEIYEVILDGKHPDLANSYNNLAVIYLKKNLFKDALYYGQKALSIREEIYENNHPKLAEIYNNISAIYKNLGEIEKALELQYKALYIREKILPENHPHLANSYYNLAKILCDLDDFKQAFIYCSKACEILRSNFPEGHPYLALCEESLKYIKSKLNN